MRTRLRAIRTFMLRALACAAFVALALLGWVYIGGGVASDETADCIIVPGAAVRKNRTPSDALRYRLERALALYDAGRAPRIIVTGGGEGDYAEGEVMAEWLAARGVPPGAIIIESEAATTRDSGVFVARIMRDHGLNSALVVSQWFHVARTRLCLSQEGVETHAVPCGGNTLIKEPYFVLREMIALPLYYCRFDELR